MALALRLSLNFLFHTTRKRYLTVFSAVSILGIAVSVFVFLLIDSIVAGLSLKLRDTLVGFEAPVIVNGEVDSERIGFPVFTTEQFEGFVSAKNTGPFGVKVRSVDREFFSLKKHTLSVFWFEGFDEDIFSNDQNAVLLGEALYEKMGIVPYAGESLFITQPLSDVGPSGEVEPQQRKLTVAGVFRTGRYDFDNVFVLISKPSMAAFSPAFIERMTLVFPKNLGNLTKVKQDIVDKYPKLNGKVMTWFEKNQKIFKAMNLEKILYTTIFLFIFSVSCFNLGALVAIFALAKLHDSAILRVLGLELREIKKIFAHMGFLLGGTGTVFGLGLGILFILLLKNMGLELPEAYGFTELPLRLRVSTIFFLLMGSPLFCGLIALVPAAQLVKGNIANMLSE